MIKEENGLKMRLVESLEHSVKQCVKLSKELGMGYELLRTVPNSCST